MVAARVLNELEVVSVLFTMPTVKELMEAEKKRTRTAKRQLERDQRARQREAQLTKQESTRDARGAVDSSGPGKEGEPGSQVSSISVAAKAAAARRKLAKSANAKVPLGELKVAQPMGGECRAARCGPRCARPCDASCRRVVCRLTPCVPLPALRMVALGCVTRRRLGLRDDLRSHEESLAHARDAEAKAAGHQGWRADGSASHSGGETAPHGCGDALPSTGNSGHCNIAAHRVDETPRGRPRDG